MTKQELTFKIKEIIINAANLEDLKPEDIKDDHQLFIPADEGGLGLDSLDAIQIAMEILEVLGVDIPQDDNARKAMQSISSLVEYIYPLLK